MRFNYPDIRKTLEESETDSSEASIEKALRSFGYERFPEAGLDDSGKNKLIAKIIEIEKNEARLMPKKEERKQRVGIDYLLKSEKREIPKGISNVPNKNIRKSLIAPLLLGVSLLAGSSYFGINSVNLSREINKEIIDKKEALKTEIIQTMKPFLKYDVYEQRLVANNFEYSTDYIKAEQEYETFTSIPEVKENIARLMESRKNANFAAFGLFGAIIMFASIIGLNKKNYYSEKDNLPPSRMRDR
jgi:hypothetical protein